MITTSIQDSKFEKYESEKLKIRIGLSEAVYRGQTIQWPKDK